MSPAVSQVPCRTELSSLSDGTWFHAGGNLPLPPADVGSPAGSGWLGRRGFKRKSKSFGYSICSFKSSGLRLVCQKVAVIAGFHLLFGEAFPRSKRSSEAFSKSLASLTLRQFPFIGEFMGQRFEKCPVYSAFSSIIRIFARCIRQRLLITYTIYIL